MYDQKTLSEEEGPEEGASKSVGTGAGSAMLEWRLSPEIPPPGVVCLCRGDSYDAGAHNGYILAYTVATNDAPGESVRQIWVTGKQQSDVKVREWTLLPNR